MNLLRYYLTNIEDYDSKTALIILNIILDQVMPSSLHVPLRISQRD